MAQSIIDPAKPGPPTAAPQGHPNHAPHAERTRRVFILACALGIMLCIGVILWTTHGAAPTQYVTAALARGSVERRITATGTVNPELTIIIGSYVSGVISSMSCDYNTRVRKGQVCAQIDPRPYQAASRSPRDSWLATRRCCRERESICSAIARPWPGTPFPGRPTTTR